MSQQALATRCGLTRQAVNAIEAGQYVPNTLVALRLARALGSRIEDLFSLPEEHPRVDGVDGGDSRGGDCTAPYPAGSCGQRLLARPLTGAKNAFVAADGMTVPAAQAPRTTEAMDRCVTVDLLIDAQLLEHTVVIFGCDPALEPVGGPPDRRYPALRLLWVQSGSWPHCGCWNAGKRMRRGRTSGIQRVVNTISLMSGANWPAIVWSWSRCHNGSKDSLWRVGTPKALQAQPI